MKKLQRFLSVVLCALMCVGMILPASASGIVTSPAPTTTATGTLSVKEILKDFDKDKYTVVEFGNSGKVALAEYQGGTGVLAEHTVYDGVNATKLVAQNISWAGFAKSHIAFANNVSEFKEYGYMVVKYASESDKAYRLGIGGWGEGESVYFEVPEGKTGWTTSEVLTVSAACAAVKTSKRSIVSSSSTAETYIGDIVFFKNKADAEEYAKWAPIYLDPNGDATLRRIQKREENWETIKLIMMLIGSGIAERVALKENVIFPFEGIDEDAYSIVEFGKNGEVDVIDPADNAALDPHVTYNGVDATKLVAKNVPWADPWPAIKSNITWWRGGAVGQFGSYDYMVVRYASESDTEYKLDIGGWGNLGTSASFTVLAGKTDWTLSEVLTIPEEYKNMSAPTKRCIASTSAAADTYIADIVFFTNKKDAEKYIKQWNDYYEDELNPDVLPLDPINKYTNSQQYRITEGNYGSAVGNHSAWSGTPFNYTSTYGIACGVGSGIASTYSMAAGDFVKNPIGGTVWNATAATNATRINLGGGADPSADVAKYMVVNYYSYCNQDHQLGAMWINNLGWTTVELAKVPAKQSGWHTTEPLDLVALEKAAFEGSDKTPDLISRLASREIFLFTTGTESYASKSSLKIASIVFFANKEDADAYVAEAPAYYNNIEADKLLTQLDSASEGDIYATTFDKLGVNWEPCGDSEVLSDGTTPVYGDAVYNGVACMKFEPGTRLSGVWAEEGSTCSVSYRDMARSHEDIFTGSTAYKYVVVTYATNAKDNAYLKMTTWGTPAKAVLSNDISISEGKWVTSDIIEIEAAWARAGARKLHFYSNLKTAGEQIYIRSVNYFTDKADAEAYVKAAPEYYNGEPNNNPLYWLSLNGAGDIYVQSFAKDGFDYANAGEYTTHANTTYGANNTPCLKLESTGKVGYNSGKGGFISYTSTPTSHKTLLNGNAYPYAVVTYAYDPTGTTSPVQLLINPWYGSAPKVVVSEDMSISNGKWVTSGVIEENVKDWGSGTAAQKMQITTNADTHNPYYIQSIVYFSSKADAEYYVANAPAYYNGEDITDPSYWLSVLGEGEVYTTTFEDSGVTYDANINYSTYAEATFGKRSVPCVSFEVGEAHDYAPKSSKCYFSFTDRPGYGSVLVAGAPYKYAVVTYATNSKTPAALSAETWGTPQFATFASDITVSGGKWVTSDIVEIGMPMANNGAKKMIFYSDLTEENEPIYIREIKFFESLEDAEYYQEYAPEYYNNHYGK